MLDGVSTNRGVSEKRNKACDALDRLLDTYGSTNTTAWPSVENGSPAAFIP